MYICLLLKNELYRGGTMSIKKYWMPFLLLNVSAHSWSMKREQKALPEQSSSVSKKIKIDSRNVQELLSQTPLQHAIRIGDLQKIKALIINGCKVESDLFTMFFQGKLLVEQIFEQLVKEYSGYCFDITGQRRERIHKASHMLIESACYTPNKTVLLNNFLKIALEYEDSHTIELFAKKGISLECVVKDKSSYAELLFAQSIEEGSTVMLLKLLEAGIGINTSVKDRCPLIKAAKHLREQPELLAKILETVLQRKLIIDSTLLSSLLRKALLYIGIIQDKKQYELLTVIQLLLRLGSTLSIERSDDYEQLENIFKEAVLRGHEGLFNKCITRDINLVKRIWPECNTEKSLEIAAFMGHQHIVKRLIELGIQKQPDGYLALINAITYDHKEIVELLIAAGVDVNHAITNGNMHITPLAMAAAHDRVTIIHTLLQKGATASWSDTLHGAIKNGCIAAVKELIKAKSLAPAIIQSALTDALKEQRQDIAKELLKSGVDMSMWVKQYSQTSQNSRVSIPPSLEILALLISCGNSVQNFDKILLDSLGKASYEALYFLKACAENQVKSYLADPTNFIRCTTLQKDQLKDSFCQTPLMWACIFGHKEVVAKILEQNPSFSFVGAQDTYGRTALMYALIHKYEEIAYMLINLYENIDGSFPGINVYDKEGNTALCYAVQTHNIKLIQALLAKGAFPVAKAIKCAVEQKDDQLAVKFLGLTSEYVRQVNQGGFINLFT